MFDIDFGVESNLFVVRSWSFDCGDFVIDVVFDVYGFWCGEVGIWLGV